MKRRIILGIGILVVTLLVACGAWYVESQVAPTPNTLRASGTVESDDIIIAAEVPGRILALNVDEGAEVKAGDELVQLDTALIDGEAQQAQAALELAEANLAQVKAPARPEQIRAAEGALTQATAARDGAKQAWLDAQSARDNPQELNAKIDASRAALAVAEANVKQAEGLADAARTGQDELRRQFDMVDGGIAVRVETPRGLQVITVKAPLALIQLRTQLGLADRQVDIAFAGVDAAKAARDAAQANLDSLLAIRANPIEANARVDLAFAQYQAGEGAVKSAQAKLDALTAGALKEQIAAAEAQVVEVQAALNALKVQKAKTTLIAPRAGYVVARFANRGEMAAPNAPILKLVDLDSMTMTVYLPTSEVGRVRVGDAGRVTVDSFKARAFEGRVTFISPDAEFTPANAQTQDERANLVYAVKISLSNPGHALKPGMAGDVEFGQVVEEPVGRIAGI
jgi:HlyD family secretion protein